MITYHGGMTGHLQSYDIKKFQEEGGLLEANRKFFHPVGMALAVSPGWGPDEIDQLIPLGVNDNTKEIIRTVLNNFVHQAGLDRMHFSSLFYTDDAEGIYFAWEDMDSETLGDSIEKIDDWSALQSLKFANRAQSLGFIVQPDPHIDDEYDPDDI